MSYENFLKSCAFALLSCSISLQASEGVTPVSTLKNGYSYEQSLQLRKQYNVMHMQRGDDIGLYMFNNVSELMASKRVSRAGQVAELEYDLKPELENLVATSALGAQSLKELMNHEDARFRGIVVAQGGKIVYEAYPGMREIDSQVWMSAVKPVTALLIDILSTQGLIDTQESISHYLKELRGTEWDNSKVIDLLHMASGMDIVENAITMSDPNSAAARAFGVALANRSADNTANGSLMDIFASARRLQPAGKQMQYSTFNTQILGILIERVTHRNFADVLTDLIWSKVGMEGDGLMVVAPSGETLNGGIFSSRLRDLTRFGLLFTPSWNVVSSEKIVSDDYIKRIQSNELAAIYKGSYTDKRHQREFGEAANHNAYQWDAVFDDGDFYKAGRNGQCIYVSPSRNLVVTWFASTLDNQLFYPAYARKIALSFDERI